jgi:hypothetical protein
VIDVARCVAGDDLVSAAMRQQFPASTDTSVCGLCDDAAQSQQTISRASKGRMTRE